MTLEENFSLSVQECESIINQIKSVISGKVVLDREGLIEEIHVLSSPDRSPKQVVRDVESALMAKFGVLVDHKKISVAQMREQEEINIGGEVRPEVASVAVLLKGRNMEASVELLIGEQSYRGVATGPNTSTNQMRLVAQATVNSLESYLDGTCSIVTEDVKSFTLAGLPAVAVSVSLVTNIGEELLIGAVIIKNDEKVAAVKATLAAINRRMALLIGG